MFKSVSSHPANTFFYLPNEEDLHEQRKPFQSQINPENQE